MNLLRAQLAWRTGANETIEQLRTNVRGKSVGSYGPMNNTGEAANSFRYRWLSETRLQIYSDMPNRPFNYIFTLEYGRKPGKRPPKSAILEWIRSRGIQPTGISQESLAFLIARKIGREGSYLHKNGPSGIISQVQSEAWIRDHFIKPIEQALKQNIEQELSNTFV